MRSWVSASPTFNPDLDEDGAHARRLVDALASALG